MSELFLIHIHIFYFKLKINVTSYELIDGEVFLLFWILPGTCSHFWFPGVCKYPQGHSALYATATGPRFFLYFTILYWILQFVNVVDTKISGYLSPPKKRKWDLLWGKIIWCPRWFCNPPPLFGGCILHYLRSPKGGCCSISDDMSCTCSFLFVSSIDKDIAYGNTIKHGKIKF